MSDTTNLNVVPECIKWNINPMFIKKTTVIFIVLLKN
jgi:hypothetical protein